MTMKVYKVGGAVRDKLLGFPFRECDWVVVGATPDELLALGYKPVGKHFPVFLHPDTGEEYALARTERKVDKGYQGFDFYTHPDVTLEQDLQRRDLTINAIAETEDGSIIDPYGGQQDIKDRLLRHVSPAFVEDPLRVIRVARFVARYHHLGFCVAPETLALMQTIARQGELLTLAPERVWRELQRALQEQNPAQFFLTLQACGALQVMLPQLQRTQIAALERVAHSSEDPIVRFGALFVELDGGTAERLTKQQLKAPKNYHAMAQLIAKYADDYRQVNMDAEQRLTLLEKLDAFRRPERFIQFIDCCKGIYPQCTNGDKLQRALRRCDEIDQRSLAEQHNDQTIAEVLRRQRLQQMECS
jgi:tRNA nucleotidyltransferase (CCA-adding enzyme)